MKGMSSIWTIRRSTSDAKIAGVCGGIARHWNVDPVLVRVGWVLLALSGGVGLVLYVAGWLLIPADGKEKALIHDLLGEQADKLSREAWIAVVVVACLLGGAALSSVVPFSVGPALILALIWYFGYYRTKVRRSPGPPPAPPSDTPPPAVQPPPPTQFYHHPGPPTPFTQASDAWRERIIQVQQDTTAEQTADPAGAQHSAGPRFTASPGRETTPPTGDAPRPGSAPQPASVPLGSRGWPIEAGEDRSEPSGWARPPAADDAQAFLAHPDPVGLYTPEPAGAGVRTKPADRRSARRLRLIGLVVLGLTLTGLAIGDAAGLPVPHTAYLAASLLVVGLVLVAATWLGRARGILPVGILLALVTMVATAAPHVPPPTDWQPQTMSYSSTADFPTGGDRVDIGAASVDLSHLTLTGDASYSATVDLGAIVVTVPPETNVVVDYTVDAGSVTVFGVEQASGTELHDVVKPDAPDPALHTLTLKLTADVGQIEVKR
jgi:phage shock protein PspC (stress-responsive transcriptional regulator)